MLVGTCLRVRLWQIREGPVVEVVGVESKLQGVRRMPAIIPVFVSRPLTCD